MSHKTFTEYAKLAMEKMIEDTKTPLLRVTLSDKETSIFDSKVGGTPYLPKNAEIPTDEEGTQMKLLAQINCRDLSYLPNYPHHGILQFWLTTKWDFHEYKVLYYPKIDEEETQEEISRRASQLVEGDTSAFPVNGEYAMQFSPDYESMSNDDERFQALFCQYCTKLSGEYISEPDDEDEIYDVYELYESNGFGHKVGGYKSISQLPEYYPYHEGEDIDIVSDEREVLLFQLDSDYDLDLETRKFTSDMVSWGDSGVGHFLIKLSDLKALDFSNVRFHWDCS